MSDAVEVNRPATTWETPPAQPLDEAVWQAWKAKGRDRDRRGRAIRVGALKWASIAALLAVAGLWSQLAPYEIAIRCVLAAAAFGVMFEAFHQRQYALSVVFAGLAVLYNPVLPLLSFTGAWQRGLIVASAIPFMTSLAWRDAKVAHID